MPINLIESLPGISRDDIKTMESALGRPLPEDYVRFLLKHNGGKVDPHVDYELRVPIEHTRFGEHKDYVVDTIEEIFGFLPEGRSLDDMEGPNFILEINEMYRSEGFLPENVIAVGMTSTDSLVCMSLKEKDYGHVYYWYYYWHYPWGKEHFDQRIARVKEKYGERFDAILENPDSREFKELSDEMNYATLTKVGYTFREFIDVLKKVEYDEGESEDDDGALPFG